GPHPAGEVAGWRMALPGAERAHLSRPHPRRRKRINLPGTMYPSNRSHRGEKHEQGHGFEEKRKEETGQDHEGKARRQAGKEEEQVSRRAVTHRISSWRGVDAATFGQQSPAAYHHASGSIVGSCSQSAPADLLSWPTHSMKFPGSPASCLLAPVATANCRAASGGHAEAVVERARGTVQSCSSNR